MKVLMAASEVAGFAKTGGLADVVAALPAALAQRGHTCVIILPLYHAVRTGSASLQATGHKFTIPIGDTPVAGALWRSALPGSDIPVYLVEQPGYFERDDPGQGNGLYQFTIADGQKYDYPDNSARFIFFSRAVLEALPLLDFWPDVLHAHDWQTGLIPVYLKEMYRHYPQKPLRERYERMRTLFTIHNVMYQGLFPHWDMRLTGLDWRLFNYQQLEFYGKLNFLKAGIVFADQITTVSPTYAREIQTPYFGAGLQQVLSERRDRLHGIVNGVDYQVWNPAIDPFIAARYDVDSVTQGKLLCKAAIQRRLELPEEPRTPLLAMVARLVEQKGLELLERAGDALMAEGVQLAVLGEGSPAYHQMLRVLRARYPRQIGLVLGFDEALAHQIEAGADIFLMPSLYEPSGLNQLYSMKYGTPPVVRATGGLADTVVDCIAENLVAGTATGFRFAPYAPESFLEAVRRALKLYREHGDSWLKLIKTAMRQDWSWQRSATEYEKLYQKLQSGS